MKGSGQTPPQALQFQRLAEIAVGATARVELCRVTAGAQAGRHIVVKRLHPHVADDPQFVDMFHDEAWMTSSLRHPHVVEVVASGHDSVGPYLAVEFVRGVSLARLMKTVFETRDMFTERLVVYLGACICDGLDAAHELRGPDGEWLALVHRDVTPGNVLVGFDGHVKLADFGMAKARQRLTKTLTGLLKGQPYYMAPEQIRSQAVDRRADVFAVGVLLYELFAGRRPWEAANDLEAMRASCELDPADLAQLRPRIDVALVKLVGRCLEKDPAVRYQTAGEVRDLLRKWLTVHGYAHDNEIALARFVRRHAMRQMRWFDRALGGHFIQRRPVRPPSAPASVGPEEVTRQEVSPRLSQPPPAPAHAASEVSGSSPEVEAEEIGEVEDMDPGLFDTEEGPTLIQGSRKARQVLRRLTEVLGWPEAAQGEHSQSASGVGPGSAGEADLPSAAQPSSPPEATTVRRQAVVGPPVAAGSAGGSPPPGRIAPPDPSAPLPRLAPFAAGVDARPVPPLPPPPPFASVDGPGPSGWAQEIEAAAHGLAVQAEEASEHASWAVATAAAAARAASVAARAVELARQSRRDEALRQLREAYRLQAGLVRGEAEQGPSAPIDAVPWPEAPTPSPTGLRGRLRALVPSRWTAEPLPVAIAGLTVVVFLLLVLFLALSAC